jgi:tRNA threonylcarbamoyladenosine biosynthesis protein TsaB
VILTLRSDTPQFEAALLSPDGATVAQKNSQEYRKLALLLPELLRDLLDSASLKQSDVRGIVVYAGPGSFTGLRITHTYANALSYALSVPVVSISSENWQEVGCRQLQGMNLEACVVLPMYGAEANITQPRVLPKSKHK